MAVIKPDTSKKPQLVSTIHVPTNNILHNTIYRELFNLPDTTLEVFAAIDKVRSELYELYKSVLNEYSRESLVDARSSIFLLREEETKQLAETYTQIPVIKYLVDRAVNEAKIFSRNGINILHVENIGAPYYIGKDIPFEELLTLYVISQEIRKELPELVLGVHVLASDEIEALPIAIGCDAYYVRSESAIFSGDRPEGKTVNHGNLAKYYTLRNWFNLRKGISDPEERRYPQIWTDLQKKHTEFEEYLSDINIWLGHALFMKLEALIITGFETGKDVTESDFIKTKAAIDKIEQTTQEKFGKGIKLPLITGSGLDVELYKKYADFIITGTQNKKNKYWENEVDEENVKALVAKFS
ncbi:hypothetical protein JW766_05310 [Candidatus Dojkabacteria bacterium]|nr:hypothetical protein [Candidatus Dojkabacteria bacterium]